MSEEASKLAAIVDGATISEGDAKALWKEFSDHMEEKRGDMAGYAKKKGWFSVLPEYRGGKAVLIVRTTATAKGPPPIGVPQKGKPQQKARPKPPQSGKPQPKPQQKAAPKPQPKAAQKPQPKAPQKPQPKAKPAAQGGQAPPKKRPG